MNEKPIEQMNAEELRASLSEYEQSQRGPVPSAPDAPGVTGDMSEAARNKANTIYEESILAKPPGLWSDSEREFIRDSIASVLAEIDHK